MQVILLIITTVLIALLLIQLKRDASRRRNSTDRKELPPEGNGRSEDADAEREERKSKTETHPPKPSYAPTSQNRTEKWQRQPKSFAWMTRQSRNPPEYGGSSRGPHSEIGDPEKPVELLPELAAIEREASWVLGVIPPAGSAPIFAFQVQLAGAQVQFNDQLGLYPVHSLEGRLTVRAKENGKSYYTDLSDADFFLFKLAGVPGLREGRRVKFLTRGFYLVVVPGEWEVDQQTTRVYLGGRENVSITGFKGFLLRISDRKKDRVVFHLPNGKKITADNGESRFDLNGNRIEDDSIYAGPLFGLEPPRLALRLDGDSWADISQIVLVQEGREFRGTRRWRNYCLIDKNGRQEMEELGSLLAKKQGGWFSARIYDRKAELIESVDFRFLRALRSVQFIRDSKQLRLVWLSPCSVEVLVPERAENPEGVTENRGVRLTIPYSRDWAVTEWRIESSGAGIEARFVLYSEMLNASETPSKNGSQCGNLTSEMQIEVDTSRPDDTRQQADAPDDGPKAVQEAPESGNEGVIPMEKKEQEHPVRSSGKHPNRNVIQHRNSRKIARCEVGERVRLYHLFNDEYVEREGEVTVKQGCDEHTECHVVEVRFGKDIVKFHSKAPRR